MPHGHVSGAFLAKKFWRANLGLHRFNSWWGGVSLEFQASPRVFERGAQTIGDPAKEHSYFFWMSSLGCGGLLGIR